MHKRCARCGKESEEHFCEECLKWIADNPEEMEYEDDMSEETTPRCARCGKESHEELCAECIEWIANNPKEAKAEMTNIIGDMMHYELYKKESVQENVKKLKDMAGELERGEEWKKGLKYAIKHPRDLEWHDGDLPDVHTVPYKSQVLAFFYLRDHPDIVGVETFSPRTDDLNPLRWCSTLPVGAYGDVFAWAWLWRED